MSTMRGADPTFRERLISVFGDAGAAWLEALPSLVKKYTRRWHLTLGDPFLPLSYNYVIAATCADGTDAVLKLGVPRDELRFEPDALRHFDGRGSVRLLDADVPAGVLLIERAPPGIPIITMEDDLEATRITAGLMRRLWRSPEAGHTFQTVADWGRAFGELRARHAGGTGSIPPSLFAYAEELYFALDASRKGQAVLHGDLHHWNILSAKREPWLAIDPHGVVGDPAFEVGSWMRNPVADAGDRQLPRLLIRRRDFPDVLSARLNIFADVLGLDRYRLRDSALAFAVLSACWSDESGHSETRAQAVMVAEQLRAL